MNDGFYDCAKCAEQVNFTNEDTTIVTVHGEVTGKVGECSNGHLHIIGNLADKP